MRLQSLLALLALFSTVILSTITPILHQRGSTPRLIIYYRHRQLDIHSIFSLTPDGRDMQLLAQGDITAIDVFPNGEWVLYRHETLGKLFRVNVHGTIHEALLNPHMSDTDYNFVTWWDTDSSKMIVSGTFLGKHNLAIIDPESQQFTLLIEEQLSDTPRYIGHTTDGDWIFYSTSGNRGTENTLFRVRSDGTDTEALATSTGQFSTVEWLADNTQKLLYTTWGQYSWDYDLWLLDVNNLKANFIATIDNPFINGNHPMVDTPLLVSVRDDLYRVDVENAALEYLIPNTKPRDLVLMEDGQTFSSLRDIDFNTAQFLQGTFENPPDGLEQGFGGFHLHSISPNGEWLVFDRFETPQDTPYYAVEVGSGKIHHMEVPNHHVIPPPYMRTWSPDSQFAYFEIYDTTDWLASDIFRWSLKDRVLEQITDLEFDETIIGWGKIPN